MRHKESVDLAFAALAGPERWLTRDTQPDPILRAALAGGLAALAGNLTVMLVVIGFRGDLSLSNRGIEALVAVGATIALSQSSWLALRAGHARARLVRPEVVRVLAFMAISVVWMVAATVAAAIAIWPLGLFAGAEGAVVAVLVGSDVSTRQMVRLVAKSPVHLGVLAAIMVVSLAIPDPTVRVMLASVSLGLEAVLVAGLIAYGVARAGLHTQEAHTAGIRVAEQRLEADRRAHWLHDDVCADIRELRMRARLEHLDHERITDELDRLDDRMRQRQLDEIMRGGSVEVAEIIQPYVRRAQNAGLKIASVPRFESASVKLQGVEAELMRRSIAGFVSNAMNAGATTLDIGLRVHDDCVELSVGDDAGGFDLSAAPAGRGLSALADDLGEGGLRSCRQNGGTTMTATIRLEGR